MKGLRAIFTLDLRSLAVLRIGLGLLILGDLSLRSQALVAHYTDDGIAPRDLVATISNPLWVSLHSLSGSAGFEIAIFAFSAVVAVSLIAGYRTFWATLGSWALLTSLHNRNPLVLSGADTYIRLVMFWCLFLPLGARFSVDSRRAHATPPRANAYFSAATVALVTQLIFVYVFAGLCKWYDPTWHFGMGLFFALQREQYVTSLGLALLPHLALLKALNPFVIACETLAPLLLLVPIIWPSGRKPIRAGLIALFWGFHLGNIFMLDTVAHSLVGMVAWTSMLPWAGPEALATDVRRRPAWLQSAVVALLAYVSFWNLTWFSPTHFRMPAAAAGLGNLLRLDQDWDMFTNLPIPEGWFVVEGDLYDGRRIDLFQGGRPVDFAKPAVVSSTYHLDRWRKFFEVLYYPVPDSYVHNLGHYLCQSWNSEHKGGDTLQRVEIFFMAERPIPPMNWTPAERKRLWVEQCLETPLDLLRQILRTRPAGPSPGAPSGMER